MTEKDFERIGQLIDSRLELMESRFNVRFEQIDARLTNLESFKSEIISEFNHSLDIKAEEFSRLFQVAAEGHAALVEREERLEERVEEDEAKLERYSLDLLVHDADPRAHTRRGGCQVKEEEAVFGDVDPFQRFDPEFRKCLLETRKRLDDAAEEVRAYCADKGIELPLSDREAMYRLLDEIAQHRVEQRLNKR